MHGAEVFSATDDYAQLVSGRSEFDERALLEPVAGQIGVVAAGEELVALEVIGHIDAWEVLSSRLLSSYLLALAGARTRRAKPPEGRPS